MRLLGSLPSGLGRHHLSSPVCTYLAASGIHWTSRGLRDADLTREALDTVRRVFALPVARLCLENPVGLISSQIGRPTQIVQPYDYGEDASKKTALWLRGLPKLRPTQYLEPRLVNGKPRWGNQTDSGQNALPPADTRWKTRSRTYPGIAEAMARQWFDRQRIQPV